MYIYIFILLERGYRVCYREWGVFEGCSIGYTTNIRFKGVEFLGIF